MTTNDASVNPTDPTSSFYHRPEVHLEEIPYGPGVPFGVARISHPDIGIGGAYGTWGNTYDNEALIKLAETHFGKALTDEERLDLSPLGFHHRQHTGYLTEEEHIEVELEVGARMLSEAAAANGWAPEEVEGVLIGMSGPVTEDYTEQIARRAGIPDQALKASIHKACDSSVGALHLALNPDLEYNQKTGRNIAKDLLGKKVLVGGVEGLTRLVSWSKDKMAFQIFGNGAGVIGVIPGKTMEFLVGKAHEVFDIEGVLAFKMYYPHSGTPAEGDSMVEVSETGKNHIRFAGLMHEPSDGTTVTMAGPMGMVKLFVRTGVKVVREVYRDYQGKMNELGTSGKQRMVAIVHHANYKINRLKDKHLRREGINLEIPWVVSEFGNVSAASNMIAFLRELPKFKPGEHILFDGFGAGTYYDAFTVALGKEKK